MLQEVNDITYLNSLSEYKVSFNAFNKVLGYYLNNTLVGFLDYSIMYQRIEINYLFVVEKYRRQNIASKLLSFIINNYEYDNITLEVKVDNEKAINLYKKHGFKIINTRPNYYNGVDGYLMERR